MKRGDLAAPVSLNVACFLYLRPGLDDAALDALNKAIEVELQEQGIAVVSGTAIRGRYVLHMAHCNHRTRLEDLDMLVREAIRMGHFVQG